MPIWRLNTFRSLKEMKASCFNMKIDAFADRAADDSIFDWFDAAALSWQLGRRINVC